MILQALVLIVVSLVSCVASAQSDSAESRRGVEAEARVHFERGVELYREGSYDAALAEFERTNQLAPNYRILYNLAQVQAERHEYIEAVKLLNQYTQAGGSQISAERKQAVAQDLEKLHQRISALTVEVSVPGAEVFVNDVSVGRSPLPEPVQVNVGTCKIRAEKPGFIARTQTIVVAGADQPRVSFTLVAEPRIASTARTTTIKTNDMMPFWISAGAAVALGGATGVFGGLALNANHDLDQKLNSFPTQSQELDSARRKVRTMAALTDGFGAGAIVAAGAAVYFLIMPPEHTEVVPTTGVHARVSPTLTGMNVSGTF